MFVFARKEGKCGSSNFILRSSGPCAVPDANHPDHHRLRSGSILVRSSRLAFVYVGLLSALTRHRNCQPAPQLDLQFRDDSHCFGLTLNVIDVGWPKRCSTALRHHHWSGYHSLALIVDLLLFWLTSLRLSTSTSGTTGTTHSLFLVANVTNIAFVGFCCGNHFLFLLTQPQVTSRRHSPPGRFYLPGFSLSAYAPVAGLNWLIDKIPGVRHRSTSSPCRSALASPGEPLGTVIGLIIGVLCRLSTLLGHRRPITKILTIGVTLGLF